MLGHAAVDNIKKTGLQSLGDGTSTTAASSRAASKGIGMPRISQ